MALTPFLNREKCYLVSALFCFHFFERLFPSTKNFFYPRILLAGNIKVVVAMILKLVLQIDKKPGLILFTLSCWQPFKQVPGTKTTLLVKRFHLLYGGRPITP